MADTTVKNCGCTTKTAESRGGIVGTENFSAALRTGENGDFIVAFVGFFLFCVTFLVFKSVRIKQFMAILTG